MVLLVKLRNYYLFSNKYEICLTFFLKGHHIKCSNEVYNHIAFKLWSPNCVATFAKRPVVFSNIWINSEILITKGIIRRIHNFLAAVIFWSSWSHFGIFGLPHFVRILIAKKEKRMIFKGCLSNTVLYHIKKTVYREKEPIFEFTWLLMIKGASKNCFCYENVRNILRQGGRSKSPQA